MSRDLPKALTLDEARFSAAWYDYATYSNGWVAMAVFNSDLMLGMGRSRWAVGGNYRKK